MPWPNLEGEAFCAFSREDKIGGVRRCFRAGDLLCLEGRLGGHLFPESNAHPRRPYFSILAGSKWSPIPGARLRQARLPGRVARPDRRSEDGPSKDSDEHISAGFDKVVDLDFGQ